MPIVDYSRAINDLAEDISDLNEQKGFWDAEAFGDIALVPTKLALISSEVTEALDVHRKEYDDDVESLTTLMTPMQEDDFTEEMADVIIRVLDVCGYYDLDIGTAIIDKIEKNRFRPHKHSKRY